MICDHHGLIRLYCLQNISEKAVTPEMKHRCNLHEVTIGQQTHALVPRVVGRSEMWREILAEIFTHATNLQVTCICQLKCRVCFKCAEPCVVSLLLDACDTCCRKPGDNVDSSDAAWMADKIKARKGQNDTCCSVTFFHLTMAYLDSKDKLSRSVIVLELLDC